MTSTRPTTAHPRGALARRSPTVLSGWLLRIGPVRRVVHPRAVVVTAALTLAALVLGCVAMTLGAVSVPPLEVLPTLLDPNGGQDSRVLRNIRLPRAVAALMAGAALGVSGAVFQSISRNALGSPDVIGLTTGAATGAIAQIVLFQAGPVQVAIGALAGGLLAAGVIYLLSLKGGVTGGYRLVLIGLGVGAMLGGVNGFLLVRGDIDRAVTANLWLVGSLDARTWLHALPVLIGTVVLVPIVALAARHATVLEMGDDLARQLGVSAERTRLVLIGTAVLLAALATAAVGPIAFIALAAPQLAARLVRSRALGVWSSAAMGACILVGADVITQALPTTITVPIGQMTGILGGVYLVWLLTRAKQL